MSRVYELIIVGGGVAGTSVAYHLSQLKVKDVLLLEAGVIGLGARSQYKVPPPHSGGDDETSYVPYTSGTAVPPEASTAKMMVTVFPATAEEFLHQHGQSGTDLYLKLSRKGLHLQKELAKKLFSEKDLKTNLHELGSVLVGGKADVLHLRAEYELYRHLGLNVEYLEESQVNAQHGQAAGFAGGIYFPEDAVINSPAYAQVLARAASGIEIRENSPRVTAVVDQAGFVELLLEDGSKYTAKKVLLATGGLLLHPYLNGILKPCYSYIAALPDPRTQTEPGKLGVPNSPNYFTYGFSHDWCMTGGRLRVSGEDHFSALKPPRAQKRVKALADWCYNKYPYLPKVEYGSWYGVYSETADLLPLVGPLKAGSNVWGLLGCNAWGQSTMSFGASIIPALMGYAPSLSEEDQKLADFVSPLRFTTTRSIKASL